MSPKTNTTYCTEVYGVEYCELKDNTNYILAGLLILAIVVIAAVLATNVPYNGTELMNGWYYRI